MLGWSILLIAGCGRYRAHCWWSHINSLIPARSRDGAPSQNVTGLIQSSRTRHTHTLATCYYYFLFMHDVWWWHYCWCCYRCRCIGGSLSYFSCKLRTIACGCLQRAASALLPKLPWILSLSQRVARMLESVDYLYIMHACMCHVEDSVVSTDTMCIRKLQEFAKFYLLAKFVFCQLLNRHIKDIKTFPKDLILDLHCWHFSEYNTQHRNFWSSSC
jgi:hypothetical protein